MIYTYRKRRKRGEHWDYIRSSDMISAQTFLPTMCIHISLPVFRRKVVTLESLKAVKLTVCSTSVDVTTVTVCHRKPLVAHHAIVMPLNLNYNMPRISCIDLWTKIPYQSRIAWRFNIYCLFLYGCYWLAALQCWHKSPDSMSIE